jgi:NTE family protein
VTVSQDVETRVAAVRFEGLKKVNPEYLRTFTEIAPGDQVSIGSISADATRIAALNDVDSVAYRLDGNASNPTLVWLPIESSIGHNVLRPSLGMYAGGGGDLKFLLGAQYVRYWLNDRGGQWRNNLQVGYETLVTTSWYQPFDVAQRYFVEPGAFVSRSVEDVYVDGERIAVYRFIDTGGRIDLGVNLSDRPGAAQLLNTARRAEVRTGISQLRKLTRGCRKLIRGMLASCVGDR